MSFHSDLHVVPSGLLCHVLLVALNLGPDFLYEICCLSVLLFVVPDCKIVSRTGAWSSSSCDSVFLVHFFGRYFTTAAISGQCNLRVLGHA
jgi:hypothetical protein